jgi:hypothetical protein
LPTVKQAHAANRSDRQRDRHLRDRHIEVPVECRNPKFECEPETANAVIYRPFQVGMSQQRNQRPAYDQERRHDILEQQAGSGDRLPNQHDRRNQRDAQQQYLPAQRHGGPAEGRTRRGGYDPGRSHRSIRSVAIKNITLTMMTKQMAA